MRRFAASILLSFAATACDAGSAEPDAGPAEDAAADAAEIQTDAFVPPRPDGGGRCGDGTIDAVEGCDDYNTTDGDGCSAACAVEDGWACEGEPSVCAPISCTDEVRNGGETDVDCGRVCPSQCSVGEGCEVGDDCRSMVCTGGACAMPACDDGVMNGLERDVDCGGGACDPCGVGQRCLEATDCESGVCGPTAECAAATCTDGVQNQDESDRDCGGSCDPCDVNRRCDGPEDCASGLCEPDASGDMRCALYPRIDSAVPAVGHPRDEVTLYGAGFLSGATVTFGAVPAASITIDVVSRTELRVRAPMQDPGDVDIVVSNPGMRASNPFPWRYVAPLSFAPPVEVPVDATFAVVDRVRTADVDGDLDIDVLVADGASARHGAAQPVVHVLENAGGALSSGTTITFAAGVTDMRPVLLDGDTNVDVVATLTDGRVAVALGAGGGAFGPPTYLTVGTSAGELWAGDVDLDGFADVVLTYRSGGASYFGFLGGLGDGSFDPLASVSIESGIAITALDFRNDATLEVIVGQTPPYLRIVRYDPLRGWVSDVTDRKLDDGGRALDRIDLDGDGDVDLITAEEAHINSSPGFTGLGESFTPPGVTAYDVAPGDFDADGYVDMAYVSGGYAYVRLGTVGPSFVTTSSSHFIPGAIGGGSVDAADLDGDGRLDMIVGAETSIYVFRNTTP